MSLRKSARATTAIIAPCLDCCEAVNCQQSRWHCGNCPCCPINPATVIPVTGKEE